MNEKLWGVYNIILKSLGSKLDYWALPRVLVFVYLLGVKHCLDVLERSADERENKRNGIK